MTDQDLGDLYDKLAEWQPLDDLKRLDVWLAKHVMGWHAVFGSWNPSWRYHSEEVAAINPELADDVWTGYWVFPTSVRWEDQKDSAHRIYSVKDSEVIVSYTSGSEWAPTKNRGCLEPLKDRMSALGLSWRITEEPTQATTEVFFVERVVSSVVAVSTPLAFSLAVKDAMPTLWKH